MLLLIVGSYKWFFANILIIFILALTHLAKLVKEQVSHPFVTKHNQRLI